MESVVLYGSETKRACRAREVLFVDKHNRIIIRYNNSLVICNSDKGLFIERLKLFKRGARDSRAGSIGSVQRGNAVHNRRVICT